MAKFDSFYEALNKARKKAGLESTEELAKKAAPKPQDTTLKDIGKIFQNLWSGTKNSIRGMKITSADSDVQLSNFAYKDQLSALNDAAKSPWAKTWNRDNLNVWSGMHGGVYQARRDKESTAKNNLYALSKRIEEEQKRLQELNKDSSPLVKVISDMAYSAGNMAPALPFGPGGMILQGASNYGANLADELNAGTDIEEARKRAGTRATVETGIEYLSGGLAGTAAKSGLMKPVTKAIDNVVTNNLGRKTLTRLAASAGEGAEEALTAAIMPYIDRTYLGVDTPNASVGDLAKSFGFGAGTALAIGGGQDAMSALRNRRAVNNISDKTSLSNEEMCIRDRYTILSNKGGAVQKSTSKGLVEAVKSNSYVQLLKTLTRARTVTREMCEALLERIDIDKDHNVKITVKYRDEFADFLKTIKETEAELKDVG